MFFVNTPRSPLRALFLFGTGTPWKEQELGTVASTFNDGIGVMPLNYFALFHSAVENMDTADENLQLKMDDIEKAVRHLRHGGKGHESFLKALKDNDINFVGAPSTKMDRIYAIADDTTTAIPKEIWESVLPKLQKLVVAGSLKAKKCNIEGSPNVEYVSVADIGPILSSVGQGTFFKMIQDAADELPAHKGKPVIFYNQVSCSITPLGDQNGTHPSEPLKAQAALQVRIPPKDESLPIIPTTEYFSARIGESWRSITDDYPMYLLVESTRSKIYEQMLDLVKANETRLGLTHEIPESFVQAAKEATTSPRKAGPLKLVQPSAGGSFRKHIDGHHVAIRAFLRPRNDAENEALISAKAMEFAFEKNVRPEHPDAIIFAPFDPKNKETKLYNLAKVRDAFVAKALNPALTYVPMVIMNYNGCYDEAIASHVAYATNGYNKEFIRPSLFDGLKPKDTIVTSSDVEHTPFQFCDVVKSNNWDALDAAVIEILKFRTKHYHRADPSEDRRSQQAFVTTGEKRAHNHFGATIFASASSDKKVDNANAIAVGKYLRDIGAAMIMGGGDQHTMGSLLIGYNRSNKPEHEQMEELLQVFNENDLSIARSMLSTPLDENKQLHLTCVSTHDIVKVETVNGKLPQESDYTELHRTIGPRLETLMKGNLYISVGGGDGTGQETNCVLSRIFHNSPQTAGKKMIFIGATPSMLAEMASIIGPKNLAALKENPYALEDKGIYLFTNADDAKPIIAQAKADFDAVAPAVKPAKIPNLERVLFAPAY